jgi:hypothetical protein
MTNHELALVRSPSRSSVPLDLIHKQRTAEAAFCLAIATSGLDDKEIYLALRIDAGHWSRMKKGDAGFPPNMMHDFCYLVGNSIYPEWIAYQVGCQLVEIRSEAERRADEAEARARDAEAQVAMLKSLLVGRAQ